MRKGTISLVLAACCGFPTSWFFVTRGYILTPIFSLDLLVDRLLQRHFPRGNLRIPYPIPIYSRAHVDRFMFPLYLRITLQMLRSMVNMSSWLFGIPPDRKTMIVSGPSVTPTHTSSSFASLSTRQIRLITYRRRCVHILNVTVTYTHMCMVPSGSQK